MFSETIRYRIGLITPIVLLLACFALLLFKAPLAPDNAAKGSGVIRAASGPPAVEPLILRPVAIEDARTINRNIPFVRGSNPPARPFLFTGDGAARGRAADCLAAAMLYEAGNDPAGQRAVAQVVINRARHPAFPASICGVVFQGSERKSGCQFTFTCDGALSRRYSDAAWLTARLLANDALSGGVYAPVGHATHYHTDWVVPYWSESLDKIAAVGSHLFFRWRGSWGRPAAFRRGIAAGEPSIAKMAAFSPFHRDGGDALASAAAIPTADSELASAADFRPAKREIATDNGARLLLDKAGRADEYLALAQAKCAGKSYCKILGWIDEDAVPEVGEIGEAGRSAMVFSYLRDEENNFEKALWNCKIYPRANKRQCMKR